MEVTNGTVDPAHYGPIGDAARHVASYCDGAARVHVYTAAFTALATTRAELAASKERERETLAVLQTAHESEAALVAERDRLREALAETREMLGLCEQIICDETCPTTWRTADGQPHGQMHKDICDVLARHEHHIYPARAALTEPTDEG